MALSPQMIYLTAALGCASLGSFSDLRSRRIPNWLTGPAIVAGMLLHLGLGGPKQLMYSALAGLVAGGIFLLFFLAGGMGAGDVKLMAAVGCLAGTTHIGNVLIATVLAGGCMGVALALYHGRLRETVLNVWELVQHHTSAGLAVHPELNVRNASTLRLPYALPIATGCFFAILIAHSSGAGR